MADTVLSNHCLQCKPQIPMPSKYIVEQAELLRRTGNAELVLQNMRETYAASSFASQMSRVKQQWFLFNDRHESFQQDFQAGLRSLRSQRIAPAFIDKYLLFGRSDLRAQHSQQKAAARKSFSGSKRTDDAIAATRLLPEYMSQYRMSRSDKEKSVTLASKSIEARSMKCIDIDDADALVTRCKSIVTALTEDPFLITAAVGVLCGRRSCEILRTGVFDTSSKGAHACLFHGAAKKRGAQRGEHIPIMCKFKYLSRAVTHVRREIDACSISNTQMNSKYSHKLGDAAKILTQSLDTRFHDLRAVYAMVTHQVFDNDCSVNIWLKKTLLHDSIETSVFYSRCKVVNYPPKLGRWTF